MRFNLVVLALALAASFTSTTAEAGVCKWTGQSCYTEHSGTITGIPVEFTYSTTGLNSVAFADYNGESFSIYGDSALKYTDAWVEAMRSGGQVTVNLQSGEVSSMVVPEPPRMLDRIEMVLWNIWFELTTPNNPI